MTISSLTIIAIPLNPYAGQIFVTDSSGRIYIAEESIFGEFRFANIATHAPLPGPASYPTLNEALRGALCSGCQISTEAQVDEAVRAMESIAALASIFEDMASFFPGLREMVLDPELFAGLGGGH